jgi:hypothetical protein
LYAPVKEKYDRKLSALISRNAALLNSPYESFMFRNVVYKKTETTLVPRKLNNLHPSLRDEMIEYLKEVEVLNDTEVPHVLGYINQVLNASNDLHDYLRLFPEVLHRPIQRVIDSCACRTTQLTDEVVDALRLKNEASIQLVKQRMVLNLIT